MNPRGIDAAPWARARMLDNPDPMYADLWEIYEGIESDLFDRNSCDGSAESCRCAERDEDGNLPDDGTEE